MWLPQISIKILKPFQLSWISLDTPLHLYTPLSSGFIQFWSVTGSYNPSPPISKRDYGSSKMHAPPPYLCKGQCLDITQFLKYCITYFLLGFKPFLGVPPCLDFGIPAGAEEIKVLFLIWESTTVTGFICSLFAPPGNGKTLPTR